MFLLIITGWGKSGQVILQISVAFFRAHSKKFSGKDGSAPLEKNWPVRLWALCNKDSGGAEVSLIYRSI